MFDLTGKVAVVTGGNGGIGLGMAEAMAKAGADVCIWGTSERKNAEALEKLDRHGTRVTALQCDVGDEGAVEELLLSRFRSCNTSMPSLPMRALSGVTT